MNYIDDGETLHGLTEQPTRDYLVTVCAECLCASCWHGTFMCQKARSANVRTVKASEMPLGPEHPDHYSPRRLLEVEGQVRWL